MRLRRFRKILRNTLAFTMIELVMVVALMAILAAALVPTIRSSATSTSDKQRTTCFQDVRKQTGLVVRTYNTAMAAGNVPRLGGYNLTSARGMQECLRAANNHPDIYDIELTTVNKAPEPTEYNYIDTIVICIQFKTKSDVLIKNAQGIACSPEFATAGTQSYKCEAVNLWYVKKDSDTIFKTEGAL